MWKCNKQFRTSFNVLSQLLDSDYIDTDTLFIRQIDILPKLLLAFSVSIKKSLKSLITVTRMQCCWLHTYEKLHNSYVALNEMHLHECWLGLWSNACITSSQNMHAIRQFKVFDTQFDTKANWKYCIWQFSFAKSVRQMIIYIKSCNKMYGNL